MKLVEFSSILEALICGKLAALIAQQTILGTFNSISIIGVAVVISFNGWRVTIPTGSPKFKLK